MLSIQYKVFDGIYGDVMSPTEFKEWCESMNEYIKILSVRDYRTGMPVHYSLYEGKVYFC